MDSQVLELSSGAIRNKKLNIRPCGLDFFPDGILGGSTKDKLGRQITIQAAGLSAPIKTDIPTDKRSGRPRWFFRERSWVKDFIRENRLIPGDSVIIRRVANRTYEIAPKKRKLTFIDLFAGIGGTRIAFEKAGCECVFSSE